MTTIDLDEWLREAAAIDEQAANLEKEAARLRGAAEKLRELYDRYRPRPAEPPPETTEGEGA